MVVCKICNKKFDERGIFRHMLWHNSGHDNLTKCLDRSCNNKVKWRNAKYCSRQCADKNHHIKNLDSYRQSRRKIWQDPIFIEKQKNNPALFGNKKGSNNPFYGRKHTINTRNHLSNVHKVNFLLGLENIHASATKFREDLGHICRSSWEANICRILKFINLRYEYESSRCHFNLDDCVYICDWYLPEVNIYIKCKGYLRDHGVKLRKFANKYPNIQLKVIDSDVYNILQNIYINRKY